VSYLPKKLERSWHKMREWNATFECAERCGSGCSRAGKMAVSKGEVIALPGMQTTHLQVIAIARRDVPPLFYLTGDTAVFCPPFFFHRALVRCFVEKGTESLGEGGWGWGVKTLEVAFGSGFHVEVARFGKQNCRCGNRKKNCRWGIILG
jgi:hypothetical protein